MNKFYYRCYHYYAVLYIHTKLFIRSILQKYFTKIINLLPISIPINLYENCSPDLSSHINIKIINAYYIYQSKQINITDKINTYLYLNINTHLYNNLFKYSRNKPIFIKFKTYDSIHNVIFTKDNIYNIYNLWNDIKLMKYLNIIYYKSSYSYDTFDDLYITEIDKINKIMTNYLI